MWEGGGATGFLFIAEQAVEFPQVLASIIGICLNIKRERRGKRKERNRRGKGERKEGKEKKEERYKEGGESNCST